MKVRRTFDLPSTCEPGSLFVYRAYNKTTGESLQCDDLLPLLQHVASSFTAYDERAANAQPRVASTIPDWRITKETRIP